MRKDKERPIWHARSGETVPLPIDPGYFGRIQNLGIGTLLKAQILCPLGARSKIVLPRFDHTDEARATEVPSGTLIAREAVERDDVVLRGTAFYKSSGPGLTPVGYTCLFSPMLGVKAVQLGSGPKTGIK